MKEIKNMMIIYNQKKLKNMIIKNILIKYSIIDYKQ